MDNRIPGNPCAHDSVVTLAGANDNGIIFAVSDDFTMSRLILWSKNVMISSKKEWNSMAFLNLPSSAKNFMISAVLTCSETCVDVLLYNIPTADITLHRFNVLSPEENRVFSHDHPLELRPMPSLHCLDRNRLIMAGVLSDDEECRFRVWELRLEEDQGEKLSMRLMYVSEPREPFQTPATVCADENFVYIFDGLRDMQIFDLDTTGTLRLRNNVKLGLFFDLMHSDSLRDVESELTAMKMCARRGKLCLVFSDTLYVLHGENFEKRRGVKLRNISQLTAPEFGWSDKVCAASGSDFYLLCKNGTVLRKEIGMASLQSIAFRVVCENIPAVKHCKTENEAKSLGVSRLVYHKFMRF